ncbi:expressed unknown protein [Seminavis robusta]|uniref:Uncharacterized protein n=1 Tax=Seminavis robusta TaxID=568900 RepID=A0A9N8EG10_9STRA|nr:expressed unknown protein [Seminavis robusta]|eukprot:Sro1102_g241590.1 n/a (580) ;mRNA; r:20982-22890
MSTKSSLSVSLAKGSYGEGLPSEPQMTMDSVDSNTDLESSPPRPPAAVSSAAAVGDDEHDVNQDEGITTPPAHAALKAPLSSQSLPSVQSTDQFLELNNRLDLSDSSAIMSSLKKDGKIKTTVAMNGQGSSSNLRSSSRLSFLSSRQLSRRPSMHDTHDEEPLRRGEFLYYLYSFAILGTVIRVYMGRLFGGDCEHPGVYTDWLSPLSQKICVTNSGETTQTGGALFLDLPANILGSFVMGLVSSLNPEGGRKGSKLPWLHNEHPLQKHEGIHHAIKVGLCGSLTTFASWNSQMIIMMDGTYTELGPQVVPALFGYIVGMACAVWGFTVGGRVHEWVYDWSNGIKDSESDERHPIPSLLSSSDELDDDEEQAPTSWDSEESGPRQRIPSKKFSSSTKKEVKRQPVRRVTVLAHKVGPFLLAVGILAGFVVGFTVYDNQFYREAFACSLLTPVGVHLRWKLASLNGRGFGEAHKYQWVPVGTFTGNMIAAVISIVFAAVDMKFSHRAGYSNDHPWVIALVVGMKTGLAGALSTVSSFVKESVNLASMHPTHAKAYIYSATTISCAMLLGITIYAPWMRYG